MKNELKELFDGSERLCEQFMYGDVYDTDLLDEYEYSCVDSYGGEGQGDDFYSVWSFSKDGETVFVKFQGWYASYVGAEFTGWQFVEPKKKEVVVYL